MKFLLISGFGDGLGLALRLKQEGNDVAAYVHEARAKSNYNRLLQKPRRWEHFLDKETVVLFDSLGGGRTADRLRSQDYKVLGGSVFADQLGLDKDTSEGFVKEQGVELPKDINSTGWFDGVRFLPGMFSRSVERNKLMPGELGPAGHDTMGLALRPTSPDQVVQTGLQRLAPVLGHHGYVGPITLNSNGIIPRFRYDELPAFLELYDGEVGKLLSGLARGQGDNFHLKPGYSTAIRTSVPPYPLKGAPTQKGVEISGLTREDRPHSYFYDVELTEDNKLVTSGAYGRVAAFTGSGDSLDQALDRAYDPSYRLNVPDKQLRNDLRPIFHQVDLGG